MNRSGTWQANSFAIRNASGRLGSYLSVSTALIVCRETPNLRANSPWLHPATSRYFFSRFSKWATPACKDLFTSRIYWVSNVLDIIYMTKQRLDDMENGRDRPVIEVTPAMLEAGERVIEQWGAWAEPSHLANLVFEEMISASRCLEAHREVAS